MEIWSNNKIYASHRKFDQVMRSMHLTTEAAADNSQIIDDPSLTQLTLNGKIYFKNH